MSETKHTPGEWRAGIEGDDCYPTPEEDSLEIACVPHNTFDAIDVFCASRDGGEASYAEHVANARLIAAAPDLLAACKRAEAAYGAGNWAGEEIGEQLQAAIAKAEGHNQ